MDIPYFEGDILKHVKALNDRYKQGGIDACKSIKGALKIIAKNEVSEKMTFSDFMDLLDAAEKGILESSE